MSQVRADEHFPVVRLRACYQAPYLSAPLLAATVVPAPGIGTMSVDRWGRVYYDSALFGSGPGAGRDKTRKWSYEQGASAFIHEIWHWLRGHHERMESLVRHAEFPHVAAHLANICGDCEINDGLVEDGAVLWTDPQPFLPSDQSWPNDLTVEEYWGLLQSQLEIVDGGWATEEEERELRERLPAPTNRLPRKIIVKRSRKAADTFDLERILKALRENCGSAAHGLPQDWELPGPGEQSHDPETSPLALGRAEREQLADQVARQIAEQLERGVGNLPAGVVRWAEARLTPPQIPWEKELGALVRGALSMAAGAADYSYQRPSPRGGFGGFVMPGMVRPEAHAHIVLDTSASMDESRLRATLSETEGILRACGQRSTRVICCDAAAAPAQSVAHALDVQLIGGGGTNMGAGIEAAARDGARVVIVLTDMGTPWPERLPRGIQLVVGAIGTEEELRRFIPTAPAYAQRVLGIRVDELDGSEVE